MPGQAERAVLVAEIRAVAETDLKTITRKDFLRPTTMGRALMEVVLLRLIIQEVAVFMVQASQPQPLLAVAV